MGALRPKLLTRPRRLRYTPFVDGLRFSDKRWAGFETPGPTTPSAHFPPQLTADAFIQLEDCALELPTIKA